MAAAPTPAPSTWDTIKTYASEAADLYEAPVDDAAAVIGVEAAWLTSFLLALKFVATGVAMVHHDSKRH